MSGFDQSSIAVSMPTVTGTAAALGGPFKIKPSEAFSGALMTVSGLTGETISVQTSPDGYWGAPASPSFYRTDWQGTQLLYSTARTNLILNSLFIGGGAAPTNWVSPIGTGTSVPVASTTGGPGTAYLQTATAQRPFLTPSATIAISASTNYCYSFIVESVSGGLIAEQCIDLSTLPAGSVRTWPVCSANPSGGNTGVLIPGILVCLVSVSTTAGTATLRTGIGNTGNATGTLQFSHPQFEVGSVRTSWISTGTATTITDYTLSNGVITLAETPVTGATLSYDNSVLPSPYYIFATGDGVRSSFAYDGVWGTLSANSGLGNGIWQVDLRGAQAYRLVKSAGAETATVNMTLKRDALQYKNSAGTWSVT